MVRRDSILEGRHRQVIGAEIARKADLQILQLLHDEHFPQHLTNTLIPDQVTVRHRHPKHVKRGREGASYVSKQTNASGLLNQLDPDLLGSLMHLPPVPS